MEKWPACPSRWPDFRVAAGGPGDRVSMLFGFCSRADLRLSLSKYLRCLLLAPGLNPKVCLGRMDHQKAQRVSQTLPFV